MRCDNYVIGCTGEATRDTVTGQHLCPHCGEERDAAESACMAGNGIPPPVAFVSWWRRLLPGAGANVRRPRRAS